jgi:hypothetical protein
MHTELLYTQGKRKDERRNAYGDIFELSNCVWAVCWCICCLLNKGLIWTFIVAQISKSIVITFVHDWYKDQAVL